MIKHMGPHTLPRAAEARVILDAIRQIVRTLHESSRAAERLVGLSGAQLFVLQTLAETPGLSLNELAEQTHTHQSSVSTVVSRLVETGLVTRVRSQKDRRRVELRLAPDGRRLAARAPDAAQARLIDGIERMPAASRRTLARTLAALTNAMDLAGGEPVMFFAESARGGRGRRG
jgi:DNA-binding MarR family transcriptional regulator